mmetsp:Transcript_49081/g.96777  ORF Transcript_49081/g.96777 Transcript_49081/m.96777 type:complete len:89 (+) Transcript_49081:1598-1864(+)
MRICVLAAFSYALFLRVDMISFFLHFSVYFVGVPGGMMSSASSTPPVRKEESQGHNAAEMFGCMDGLTDDEINGRIEMGRGRESQASK